MILSFLPLGGCAAGVFFSLPTGKMAEASKAAKSLRETHAHDSEGLSYVRTGNAAAGTTFFFVHGTPGSLDGWGGFLGDEELSKEVGMVAFDRLGHGESHAGEAEPELAEEAKALARVAALIRGDKIWVGHSYGVPVIGRLAADYPDLVDGAVLVAGPVSPEHAKRRWYQSLAATGLAQVVIPQSLKVANLEMLSLEEELKKMEESWENVKFPVTVIHAEDDVLTDFGNVSFLKEEVPKAYLRLKELESGNHFLIWSHKELVMAEMRTMMQKVKK